MRHRKLRADTLIRLQHEKSPHVYVSGLQAESEGTTTITVSSPATGELIGRTPAAVADDVDKAVESSYRAFHDRWRRQPASERSRLLWTIAEVVEREAEDLAILEALQTGKTFREVFHRDVLPGVAALRYFAGWVGRAAGESHDLGADGYGLVRKEPHPVVGMILPWTQPLGMTLRKLAAALAAGTTVIIKPPEQAPLSILHLAELMHKSGLPPGVVNVVPGYGDQAGTAIAEHPQISVLDFAGSIETARRILLGAARSNLKRTNLELGGKSVAIIFEDADRSAAVHAVTASILTSGCTRNTACARLLVHHSIYAEVATMVAERARSIVIGDPLDEHTELGPLISEAHAEVVLGYIDLGCKEGAKMVAGGGRDPSKNRLTKTFVLPTVFMDVRTDMRITREEIRGPVLTIQSFHSDAEAAMLANDTDYGMGAAIFTKDVRRSHAFAAALSAGIVWINQYDTVHPALPFGGRGLSGSGQDLGRQALDQYTLTKAIYVP